MGAVISRDEKLTNIQILNRREEVFACVGVNGPRETIGVTQTVNWKTSICTGDHFLAEDNIVGELTRRQIWYLYMFHEKQKDVGAIFQGCREGIWTLE